MKYTITNQIKNEIIAKFNNKLFTIKDLINLGSYETIKRLLIRLEKEGFILRVINGIYIKPKYSKLTNELVPVSPHEVAIKIADSFSWKIIPTGNYALNFLGLSDQVPINYEYLSSGPYREYKYNNSVIKFKNTKSNDIELDYKFSIIVSAIRTIGRDNINNEIISKLKNQLTKEEQQRILIETKKVTNWIYEVIREVYSID